MNAPCDLLTLYPFDNGYQEQLLECLADITDYPFDEQIDRPLLAVLMKDFPEIDLLEQIKAFRWHYDGNPAKHFKSLRPALRRWLANALRFDRQPF